MHAPPSKRDRAQASIHVPDITVAGYVHFEPVYFFVHGKLIVTGFSADPIELDRTHA